MDVCLFFATYHGLNPSFMKGMTTPLTVGHALSRYDLINVPEVLQREIGELCISQPYS